LERIKETIVCHSLNDIPAVAWLASLPRYKHLTIVFEESVANRREEVGEEWKRMLPGFCIGIHYKHPEIYVSKLITREEVVQHQLFFEQCAKDYKALATALIDELATHLNVVVNVQYPMVTFKPLYKNKIRMMGEWEFGFHGSHCRFEHAITQQTIEASLLDGLEFGVLDPLFFTDYITSTATYFPLPVAIYEGYHDGVQIIQTMLELGLFIKIPSDNPGQESVVVTDGYQAIPRGPYIPFEKKRSWLQKWVGFRKRHE
jgi:hypothetical protein